MRQVIFLGQCDGEEHKLNVWLAWGPQPGPKSSSRQPDGTWVTKQEISDTGPAIYWQRVEDGEFRDSNINSVLLSSLFEFAPSAGALRVAPLWSDNPTGFEWVMPEEDKHRFALAALERLPRREGRFEVRWVPNDPSAPF